VSRTLNKAESLYTNGEKFYSNSKGERTGYTVLVRRRLTIANDHKILILNMNVKEQGYKLVWGDLDCVSVAV
jgi:hypothetical protein